MTIWLYGPSGSGKSTIGGLLAQKLGLPFIDLDHEIERLAGRTVSELFEQHGEAEFRQRERAALRQTLAGGPGVVALGGGALLDPENRALVENQGRVLCLRAAPERILSRLAEDSVPRPLLAGDPGGCLSSLLAARAEHYASFQLQLDTTCLSPLEAAWEAHIRLGTFRISAMGTGCTVNIRTGCLAEVAKGFIDAGLNGPAVVVSDQHVGPLYAPQVIARLNSAGIQTGSVFIPAGEPHKNLSTCSQLWQEFLLQKLERGSTVLALGGGVVGDLAGFAASVYLRGVAWVNLPTSLLAMVDAGLGGKTGVNLPQGKNLLGAFHAPRMVLIDPQALTTLPPVEQRNGLAEVVKHGIIGDEGLFALCAQGLKGLSQDWETVIQRAAAVKIKIIEQDPYERGLRQVLNFGHTLGHALERALGYRIRHGEAVAIGMVAEARCAEAIGLAEKGLATRIAACLTALGLATEIPASVDRQIFAEAIEFDKKKANGRVRFALPVRVGEVQHGVPLNRAMELLESLRGEQ
ncbi:MAG: 3-dehydroquinate synthase [Anaerolineaceae bacterium]|nr:3-dehydroquinate synthase [Anaerolineaceae bacterium]